MDYKAPKGYKEVERGNLVKFGKEGDQVSGVLLSVEEHKGKHETPLYNFTDAKTKEAKCFFGSTVAVDLMKSVKIGQDFCLIYTGKVKSKSGQKVKTFRLFVK